MHALGVDRIEGGFVLALLETGGRTPRVLEVADVRTDAPTSPAEQLRDAVAAVCPSPPEAVGSALDETRVTHRVLHLPFGEPARLAATVPFELESLVPFDLDDALTTFTVLDKSAGADVLAALALRTSLSDHLAFLAEAGLDPAVVDVGAMALAGLLGLAGRDALAIERRPGGLVALFREGRLRGMHVLGSLDEAELEREIRWLALTLAGDDPLPPVVEIGPAAASGGLAAALGTQELSREEMLPSWAAHLPDRELRAVALAGRAAGHIPAGVNFRTGEFVYHAPSEEARLQLRKTAAVAAATLLLGLVSYGVVVAERNSELEDLQQEIRLLVEPIVPQAPPGQERVRIEGAVEALERRRVMLGGSDSARPPVLDVLKLIDESVPGSIAFEVEELSIDGGSVRFRARTDSFESVDVIKRALNALPGAAEPDVRDVKKGIDDRIEFRASIEFEQGGAG